MTHPIPLIAYIKNLRQFYKPADIAEIVGLTIGAVNLILCREKKKGASFPKLRHGRLKHDKAKANELRTMVRQRMNYKQIQQETSIHRSIISRTLTMDARGELRW